MTVLRMFNSPSVDDASYLGSFALASIHSRGAFSGGPEGPVCKRYWSSKNGHNVRFDLIGKTMTLRWFRCMAEVCAMAQLFG